MTIICVKDGVVAADGSSWQHGFMIRRDCRKIVRSRDGAIGAACGLASATVAFRVWFEKTSMTSERAIRSLSRFDKDSGFQALWLDSDGSAWMCDYDGEPYGVGWEPQATGGPAMIALGAMYAGASAEEAVRICIARHDCAGGEVFVERLVSVAVGEEPEEEVEIEPADGWSVSSQLDGLRELHEMHERMGLS